MNTETKTLVGRINWSISRLHVSPDKVDEYSIPERMCHVGPVEKCMVCRDIVECPVVDNLLVIEYSDMVNEHVGALCDGCFKSLFINKLYSRG